MYGLDPADGRHAVARGADKRQHRRLVLGQPVAPLPGAAGHVGVVGRVEVHADQTRVPHQVLGLVASRELARDRHARQPALELRPPRLVRLRPDSVDQFRAHALADEHTQIGQLHRLGRRVCQRAEHREPALAGQVLAGEPGGRDGLEVAHTVSTSVPAPAPST